MRQDAVGAPTCIRRTTSEEFGSFRFCASIESARSNLQPGLNHRYLEPQLECFGFNASDGMQQLLLHVKQCKEGLTISVQRRPHHPSTSKFAKHFICTFPLKENPAGLVHGANWKPAADAPCRYKSWGLLLGLMA